MIDIKGAREAYNEELTNGIIWNRQQFKLADAMTKVQVNNELMKALAKNKLHYEIENSIIKTTTEYQQLKETTTEFQQKKGKCESQ